MSEIIFKNTETGLSANYKINPDEPILEWIENAIDLMESIMGRKFTSIERKWLRQDNLNPLPIEVKFEYEYDGDYEDEEWRDTWYETAFEHMSGYGYGWIAAYVTLRYMITSCDDDNELEILNELFSRDLISDPYSFYRVLYAENIDYENYESREELVKAYVNDDIDEYSWIAQFVDWEEAADQLTNEYDGAWYYNPDSWVAANLEWIDTSPYSKRSFLNQYIIDIDGEMLTIGDFEKLNSSPVENKIITLEEIMSFLGGDAV